MFSFSIIRIGLITVTSWIPWEAGSDVDQHAGGSVFGVTTREGGEREGKGMEGREGEGRKQDWAGGEVGLQFSLSEGFSQPQE